MYIKQTPHEHKFILPEGISYIWTARVRYSRRLVTTQPQHATIQYSRRYSKDHNTTQRNNALPPALTDNYMIKIINNNRDGHIQWCSRCWTAMQLQNAIDMSLVIWKTQHVCQLIFSSGVQKDVKKKEGNVRMVHQTTWARRDMIHIWVSSYSTENWHLSGIGEGEVG